MANYKMEYQRYMDGHGIRYSVANDTIVSVTYTGNNCQSISVIVAFDQSGNNLVEFGSYCIGTVNTDEKYADAIVLCNQLNKQYRWVKFFVDDDRSIVAKADAIVDFSSVGAECSEMVNRMVGIIDDVYPEFMRLMWA
jgi:hypothetical protein